MENDILIEVAHRGDIVRVVRNDGFYDVIRNDVVRHPKCDAESAMRALAFYMHDNSVDLMAD